MKRIITGLLLIPLVLLLVFLGPRWQWLFTLLVAGVAALAAWEYLRLVERGGANPPRIVVLAAILALFAGRFFADCSVIAGNNWLSALIRTGAAQLNFEFLRHTELVFGILALVLLVVCAFRPPVENVMGDAAVSIFCLFYVGFTLTTVLALREEANGPSLVLFLLCVVWAGDIAALYVGRAWGRHRMTPSLSPKKTWEGALGSVAGSLLATGALLGLSALFEMWDSTLLSFRDEEVWYWLVMAVVVNMAEQVGDLAESALKRSVGVKDSGDLLPGHGGILDRIDALLLAAPVLWYAQVIQQRF
jgi:phosphatidate cytidylyltransferase